MAILLFDVLDKDGIPVRLARERWDLHITEKHPEVKPYVEGIKQVIQAPNVVTLDEGGVHHLSRYRAVTGKWSELWLEVVVRYRPTAGVTEGEVLTVHFSKLPPRGNLEWMQK